MLLKKPVVESVSEGIDEARSDGILQPRRPAVQTSAQSFQSSQEDVLNHRGSATVVVDEEDVELGSSIDDNNEVRVVKISPETPPPYITTEYAVDEEYVEDDTEKYERSMELSFD